MTIINTTTQNLPELASVTEKATAFPTEVRTPEGYDGMESVTVTAPDNLEAENIRRGVTIAGVAGTYTPKLQDKSVTPETLPTRISPDSGYAGLEGVTVNKPAELVSANIKKGVQLLGYTGTYETPTETKTVTPAAFPTQVAPDTSGYHLSSVTVNAPTNLSADNIRKDTVIAGITGTYETPTESRTVTPDAFPTAVEPTVEGYHLSKVTVNKPTGLIADNIKSGTTIAGITGTYETPTTIKNVFPDAFPYEVTPPEGYALSRVTVYTPSGLVESNIKKGETIAGITGTYVTPSVSVTDTPDQFPYVITSPQEDKLLSEVTVDAPVNFKAENIKKGVSIAGVEGTYEGEAGTNYLTQACDGSLTALSREQMGNATKIRSYGFYSPEGGSFPELKIERLSVTSDLTSIGSYAFANATNLNLISTEDRTGNLIVGQYAFMNCTALSQLILRGGTVTMQAGAFQGCKTLALARLDMISELRLSSNVFKNCTSLVDVYLPENIEPGNNVFENTGIVDITLPNTYVGYDMFYNCKSLKSVSGAKIKEVASYGFYNCSQLTDVNFPNLAYIGSYAFHGCTSLSSLTMASTASSSKTIGEYAFYGCTSLKALTIPSYISSIGERAFSLSSSGAEALTITMTSATPPTLGILAFSGRTVLSIIVPKGTLDAYKAATNWSTYASYMKEASE